MNVLSIMFFTTYQTFIPVMSMRAFAIFEINTFYKFVTLIIVNVFNPMVLF